MDDVGHGDDSDDLVVGVDDDELVDVGLDEAFHDLDDGLVAAALVHTLEPPRLVRVRVLQCHLRLQFESQCAKKD